jgi:hypothetical protein
MANASSPLKLLGYLFCDVLGGPLADFVAMSNKELSADVD